MTLSTADIRQKFIEFFQQHGHQAEASSSLVPADDPTLLFTNAGMNQFKDVFLGKEKRVYTRAATSQRCVRAGGKHNDLENVGYTARHHTFFEMLGNFSFGDYFKQEAIKFAWSFLTETLQLPAEKLLVTVYAEDDDAYGIWQNEIGLPEDKIIRIATSDNFWSMGDTGPCGPCSEIFYDHGEHIWGGPPGTPEEDGDRFIEIWNLVFMQFNKQPDGTMQPLPSPSIDTGMGLERISAIMQNVHSNYEIDLFVHLIDAAAKVTGTTDKDNKSLRVIADHIRSCAFLVCDGVVPSNEGRGYVLRRIIRRAVRHGYKLGAKDIFFYKLVGALCEQMGEAYPEINERREMIEKILRVEEEQFAKTLERGLAILNDTLANLDGDTIPGDVIFKLYDTYGFPVDLTNDIARENDIKLDVEGFDAAMQAQRTRAQQASNFGVDYSDSLTIDATTTFTGYSDNEAQAKVVELIVNNESTESLADGDEAIVVLDSTPFYAESGGQIGDTGLLVCGDSEFQVVDTKPIGNAFAHRGVMKGELKAGDSVVAKINVEQRDAIRLNHSATHLLHAALREVLGEHVSQKGSLVDASKLRFDFSHFEGVTVEQLVTIERIVNTEIRKNHTLKTELMELDEAKASGAMALFGEKYDEKVRVVSMGDFSVELCGGTHVERTGDIGFFTILSESGIAAGVRRIEAITGQNAADYAQGQFGKLGKVATHLKTDSDGLMGKVEAMQSQIKQLEKELQQAKSKLASQQGADMLSSTQDISGVKVLVSRLENAEPKSLRPMMDDLKNRMGSGIIVLGAVNGEKVNLIVGVTKDLTATVKAGELVNFIAAQVGGKGGGRPDMAQAGGDNPEKLDNALNSVNDWLKDKL